MRGELSACGDYRRFLLKNLAILGAGTFIQFPLCAHGDSGYKEWERGYDIDKSSLKAIELERKKYDLTDIEKSQYLRRFKDEMKNNGLKLTEDPKIYNSYIKTWVKFEPDTGYAEKLTKKFGDSMDHSQEFFDSPLLSRPSTVFYTPSNADEFNSIGAVRSNQSIILCFEYGEDVFCGIEGHTDKGIIRGEIKPNVSLAGNASRSFSHDYKFPDLRINIKYMPIKISTSQNYIAIIYTPSVELLHHEFEKYTTMHGAMELKKHIEKNKNVKDEEIPKMLETAMKNYTRKEEIIVHGLGIEWIKKYNKDRRLGLTEDNIDRLSLSEIWFESYKGEANNVYRKIEKLGVKETIKLYAEQPDKLFDKR